MNALQERAFYKTRWLIRRFSDDAAFARDEAGEVVGGDGQMLPAESVIEGNILFSEGIGELWLWSFVHLFICRVVSADYLGSTPDLLWYSFVENDQTVASFNRPDTLWGQHFFIDKTGKVRAIPNPGTIDDAFRISFSRKVRGGCLIICMNTAPPYFPDYIFLNFIYRRCRSIGRSPLTRAIGFKLIKKATKAVLRFSEYRVINVIERGIG
jgi:hypothetical protein